MVNYIIFIRPGRANSCPRAPGLDSMKASVDEAGEISAFRLLLTTHGFRNSIRVIEPHQNTESHIFGFDWYNSFASLYVIFYNT